MGEKEMDYTAYRMSHPERLRKVSGPVDKEYIVSDWGRVFVMKDGVARELVLQNEGRYVYLRSGGRSQKVKVGYLVAREFVDNPRMCSYIRYKDGDTKNVSAGNLEWCEVEEKYKSGATKARSIVAYNMEGELVKTYESVSAASRESGVRKNRIFDVLKGRRNSAGGYIWRYEI